MIPKTIGRYEVKSELGRGGMATVYHAYDPSFDREVAIKVLPKEFLHDLNFQERFKREIKIIAALEHPAIVPVYDLGEDEDGSPYFVMRYMPGGSLTGRINQGKFSLQDAARVIEKVASGIAYAHQKEIIHRDLKPDNILFDANGDPYISDFGVASISSNNNENLTGSSAIGTPAYMSPEQAQGDKVDSRSDIYGLGVIVFHMLSGEQPYKAETPMAVALKQITEPVPDILKSNPELPAETNSIIKTAMAKRKEDRYASAIDLAKAVDQVAKSGTTGEMTIPKPAEASPSQLASTPAPAPSLPGKPMLITAGVAAIGLVLLLAVAIGFFTSRSSAKTEQISAPTLSSAIQNEQTVTPSDASFVEDFKTNFDANWAHFVTGGAEEQLTANVQDGFLNFDLPGNSLRYYAYYKTKTYADVRVDVRVENLGENNGTIALICQYNENKGWYEFKINGGGLYQFTHVTLNADKIHVSSARIANGGSPLINTGKSANEYSMICQGNTFLLSINGVEVKKVVDDRALQDGSSYAGFGVISDKGPVKGKIDTASISQP